MILAYLSLGIVTASVCALLAGWWGVFCAALGAVMAWTAAVAWMARRADVRLEDRILRAEYDRMQRERRE